MTTIDERPEAAPAGAKRPLPGFEPDPGPQPGRPAYDVDEVDQVEEHFERPKRPPVKWYRDPLFLAGAAATVGLVVLAATAGRNAGGGCEGCRQKRIEEAQARAAGYDAQLAAEKGSARRDDVPVVARAVDPDELVKVERSANGEEFGRIYHARNVGQPLGDVAVAVAPN